MFTVTFTEGDPIQVDADDFTVEAPTAIIFHKKDDHGLPQRVFAAQWALVKFVREG